MRYFDIDPILKIDASFRSSLNICNIFYPTGPELEVFEGGGWQALLHREKTTLILPSLLKQNVNLFELK